MRRLLILSFAVASLLLCRPSFGQNAHGTPPPPAPGATKDAPEPQPDVLKYPVPPQESNGKPAVKGRLRVYTRLVQVSVIAQDKDGNPVSGLTKDDFRIYDRRKEQTIASFAKFSSARLVNAGANAPASASNVFSNELIGVAAVPAPVTVILLDALNTDPDDMVPARQQTVKFISQVPPDERVALYSLTSKLIVLRGFTTDRDSLQRAAEKAIKAETSQGLEAQAPASALMIAGNSLLAWAAAASWRAEVFSGTSKVEKTVAAFRAIAKHLSGVPGRKNLVWISGTFPIRMGGNVAIMRNPQHEQADFTDSVMQAVHALSDANVAIYPIDARGLIAPDYIRQKFLGKPGQPQSAELSTLHELADGTGGLAFYNTNDVFGAIQKSIGDSRETYELGYYPSHNEWDGTFRDIKITVKRPGVHLRYRSGYVASDSSTAKESSLKQAIDDAVANSLEETEITMSVQADAVDVPGARQLAVSVRVAPGQLRFQKNAERWADDLEVVWVELDPDGKVLATTSKTVNMRLPDAAYQEAEQNGVSFSGKLTLRDDAAEVKVIARDATSGSIGSVNIPLSQLFTAATAPAAPVKQ